MCFKKLTRGRFRLNRRSIYLGLICRKQKVTVKPVQRGHPMQRTPGFCRPFFRNCRCLLWKCLIVLSKLMFSISKKFLGYLQIPRFLLRFITAIIDVAILRQMDNKRLSFIIKYMVHDPKLFLFFNQTIGIIYPVFIGYIFFT